MSRIKGTIDESGQSFQAGILTEEEAPLVAHVETNDLHNEAKKAEKAAEKKALKAAKAKAEKDLMKAINKSGLSIEDVKAKLGIE